MDFTTDVSSQNSGISAVFTGLPEQEGGGGGPAGRQSPPPPPPPQSFLSMYAFFWRALEVPFLKVVTKNVHEN